MGAFLTVTTIAAAAAIASLAGGIVALWRFPGTLFLSVALGFAGGVLLATVAFEMLPSAVELASTTHAALGFTLGFAAVYAFDLYVYRGQLAGRRSEQRSHVQLFHRRRRPRGGEVTVLAGGTSVEEIIEGVSIGVGAVIEPRVAVLIATAIAIDNFSEALSIGALIRREDKTARHVAARVLGWTGLIAAVVFGSALFGWLALQSMPETTLALLLAVGAGGMFYLSVTDLVPQAEEYQYEQSGAIASAVGFVLMFTLAQTM